VLQPFATMTKSPVFAPVTVMPLMFKGPVPQFVTVTLCTRLVEPTPTLPKFMGLALKHIAGVATEPEPAKGTIVGLLALSFTITRFA
jgi:hypothetical protein